MTWNPSPILFEIGPIAIRYYSLMFIIGFVSMGFYVKRIFVNAQKDPKLVDSLTNYLIVGMLVGSRLAHCFFYDPGYYLSHPLEILMVWKGGLASHGGYLGIILAMSLFSKKHKKISMLWLFDVVAGPAVFVGGLIRLGNFFNSEIIGRATDLPWAITFSSIDNIPRHPAQLYESIGYFSLSLFYMLLYKKKSLHSGGVISIAIITAFLFRFFVEFVKDNQSTLSTNLPINMGQILSLVFVIVGIVLFFKTKKNIHQI